MTQEESFRKQAPAPLPPRPIRLPTASVTTLTNGLSVIVVHDSRLPLVSYRLAFRTGDAHDPPGLPGLTDLLTGLLSEGTDASTSKQIAERVARMGATLSAGANSDYTTVAASSLEPFKEKILDLLADVTLNPSFPENEVKLIKENTKESLRQQRAQPSFLATEMVSRVIFGAHPYSIIAPTVESLDAITRDNLVEFHRSQFVPNNAVLIVVGNVDPGIVIKRIEGLFGDWRQGEMPNRDFPTPPRRSSRAAYLVDRPGSAQSNIVIANGGGITRTSPDYFPMLLMHTVLGANASSRLFMNLREEKGYTYGAYSSLDARRAAGSFRVSAEVRTAVTQDSLKEFFYELARIRNEPVSEREITDAKSYLTGIFPIRLETQEGLIEQLVQIKMLDLPDDFLETYRERIQDVAVDDLQRVANEYVRPDEAAIIIVGDGAEISRQVTPYSETIEVYNTEGKRKERSSAAAAPANLGGSWTLEIETPFGMNLPARLFLEHSETGLSGNVASEMGNAELLSGRVEGNSFSSKISFDISGQLVEAQLAGEIDGGQMSGTITMHDTPPLSFTGNKA